MFRSCHDGATQARRREDDISIVTAGLRVRLQPQGGQWVVSEAGMGFGGMAPTTVAAPKTEAFLQVRLMKAVVMVVYVRRMIAAALVWSWWLLVAVLLDVSREGPCCCLRAQC